MPPTVKRAVAAAEAITAPADGCARTRGLPHQDGRRDAYPRALERTVARPRLRKGTTMAKSHITLTVNGKTIEALVEPRTLLIHFLRDQQNITGPHIGCETSHCGACTVDLDGKSVKSCTVFAVQANGADIRTIEGMANADGTLHALQEGFREMHGLQCGFCTPGMITRAYRLLAGEPRIRRRKKSATASPAISAAAPAIRTSSRPFNSPPRSSTACRSRRPQNERHDPHLRRTRRQARRHGLQSESASRTSVSPRARAITSTT